MNQLANSGQLGRGHGRSAPSDLCVCRDSRVQLPHPSLNLPPELQQVVAGRRNRPHVGEHVPLQVTAALNEPNGPVSRRGVDVLLDAVRVDEAILAVVAQDADRSNQVLLVLAV